MILQLSELISRAVEQTLEERIAISFSGGVDSTVIASVAKKHANVELFTAGAVDSQDLLCADKVAAELGLPLNRVLIDDKIAMDAYAKCHSMLKLDLLKLGILVPVYCVAQAAAKKGHSVLLFGSGAEELFVGYERYYLYKEEGKDLESLLKDEFRTLPQRDIGWIKKVCRSCGLEARFPFYNKDLAEVMFSVPLEERMDDRDLKKGVLREAAKVLGTPKTALMRRKKAMQYGSGVHKMLIRRADEINRAYPAILSRPL
jgi:asparagine synthase (glutamine-hydrolysing)